MGASFPISTKNVLKLLANRRIDCQTSKRAEPLGNPWRRLRINVGQSLMKSSQASELIGKLSRPRRAGKRAWRPAALAHRLRLEPGIPGSLEWAPREVFWKSSWTASTAFVTTYMAAAGRAAPLTVAAESFERHARIDTLSNPQNDHSKILQTV